MEINHFSHGAPLLLTQVPEEDVDDSKRVICYGCKEQISSGHSAYASIESHKVYLHKACAELPTEIQYSLHSQHPLKLYAKPPYEGKHCFCNVCSKEWDGFTYHCSSCQFDVDMSCSQLDWTKIEHVIHGSHQHPLIVITQQVHEDDNRKEAMCYGCKQKIPSATTCYGCLHCQVFIHKSCVELPTEIQYQLHPQHPLKLYGKPPFKSKSCPCDVCSNDWDAFIYHCKSCQFDVDILCAQSDWTKIEHITHQAHPQHPLQLEARPASFRCDACGETNKDESYKCTRCSFWVHKTCATTPNVHKGFKHHDHPLSLAYSVPTQYLKYKFRCELCNKRLGQLYWVYYCRLCRYFVHLRCLKRKLQEDDPLEADDPESSITFTHDLLQLPAIDTSVELIQRFLCKENRLAEMKPEIKRSFHKKHPLFLFTEQINGNVMELEEEEILCDGCTEPITAPYYGCVECEYYLHSACAHLPSKVGHPSHPHKLKIGSHKKFYGTFKCKLCGLYSNGFFYKCKDCNFFIDIKCAALPNVIGHKTHKHPLVQVENSSATCGCCRRGGNSKLGYSCGSCDFFLEYTCAVLPATVRHRWDKKHPLVLRFPPHSDHPDDFICDLCENDIHPKTSIYRCVECDIAFHPFCVPKIKTAFNRKFGRRIQIGSHPHPLKHLFDATVKTSCDECGADLSEHTVFECEICYLCMCLPCVHKLN